MLLELKKEENEFLMNDLIPQGKNTLFDRLEKNLPVKSKYYEEKEESRNFYLKQNLKYNYWFNDTLYVTLPYRKNGVIAIVGGTKIGKSVRAKSIFAWILHPEYFGKKYPRPGVIFDNQGDDHRLIIHKNGHLKNNPFPLIQYVERPVAFNKERVVIRTPKYLKEDCLFDDEFYGHTLLDFKMEDWNTLNIKEASLETLQELIEANKELARNPKKFYKAFRNLRTSQTDIDTSDLKMDGYINKYEKAHLRKILRRIIYDDIIVNEEEKQDIVKDLKDGKIVIINFHEDEIWSPFYISPDARRLYNWARQNTRRYGHKHLNPLILLEEAQIVLDKNDWRLDKGGNRYITKYEKQGSKYQNLLIIITQAISEINKYVADHAVKQDFIIGNPTSNDYKYMQRILSEDVIRVIKTLRIDDRELALVHSQGNYVETFISNNSMTQIHLR